MSDSNPASKQPQSKESKASLAFVDFAFFKFDRSWRQLDKKERRQILGDVRELLDRQDGVDRIIPYTTLGIREDSDFLLWLIAAELDPIQRYLEKIIASRLGGYLSQPYSWLAMTRASTYTKRHAAAFEYGLEPLRYLVVYPFVKKREWYLLPFEERRRMIEEHSKVGRSFTKIRLNTTYSFGLDDQDFTLAFETDDLHDFQNLIISLREVEASRYTERDTPMIVCIKKTLEELFSGFL